MQQNINMIHGPMNIKFTCTLSHLGTFSYQQLGQTYLTNLALCQVDLQCCERLGFELQGSSGVRTAISTI